MNDLVQRLCQSDSRVEVSLRPDRTVKAFKECLDRGYVHVKFTETRGGTELGLKVNPELSDLSGADFANETGRTRIVGDLTLDYVDVRCIAEIDLPDLSGRGRLETRGEQPDGHPV
jgi:hypothetical protein